MNSLESYVMLLRCPECWAGRLLLLQSEDGLGCDRCQASFPVVNGCPVLLRHDNQVFNIASYVVKLGQNRISAYQYSTLRKFVPGLSVNMSSERVLSKLGGMLRENSEVSRAKVLVVGSGQQRAWLDKRLGEGEKVQVLYSDIDINADMDLICDGHVLPFSDATFDAVVTTAVLEHVLYPEQVATEIQRVLKSGGLLYSELPFMQQVHEGAYDFTRYTLSGHRRLFNYVQEIESGLVAGPATALAWAIENFALAFIRWGKFRIITKLLTRFLFGWLKYFDYLLADSPQAMDGASCTYLFGFRRQEPIPDSQIIESYIGAKPLSHT